MDRSNFYLRCLCYLFFLTFSGSVFSANVYHTEYLNGSYVTSKVVDAGQRVTVSTAKASASSSRTMQLLSAGARYTPAGLLRTTATLAIAQLISEVNWDELDDWPTRPVDGTATSGALVGEDGVDNSCAAWDPTMEGTLITIASEVYTISPGDITPANYNLYSWSSYRICYAYPIRNTWWVLYRGFCQEVNCTDLGPTEPDRVPLTETELTDILTSISPEIGDDIINNIPDAVIEEILGNEPVTDTSNEPVTVTSTGTTTTIGDTTITNTETEYPSFCGWAGVLCDLADWLQEPFESPPAEAIPYEIVGGTSDFNSGLGAGSCPEPTPFTMGGQTEYFSYQLACDAAIWFSYIFIALASLIAGYILLGHKGAGS